MRSYGKSESPQPSMKTHIADTATLKYKILVVTTDTMRIVDTIESAKGAYLFKRHDYYFQDNKLRINEHSIKDLPFDFVITIGEGAK